MSKDKEKKIGEISDGNDSFDFDKLRLSQNFSELSGVKKATLTIPVRRPNRHEFIWVRPSYNELKRDIERMGYVNTGKKYGVSDNAVRKWLNFYKNRPKN